MTENLADPLAGPAPMEIPLPNAPLVRVVSQVRFSEILSIADQNFIAGFQEAIRRDYPSFKREQNVKVTVGQGNMPNVQAETIWRFAGASNDWRLSLANNFIALETRAYQSRADFVSRFEKVLLALAERIEPSFTTRIGIRYIDRVRGEPFERICDLVAPQIIGALSSPLRSSMTRMVTQTTCIVPEGKLLARWGLIPKNTNAGGDALGVIQEDSWFLDFDVFKAFPGNSEQFNVSAIRETSMALASRAYAFFRWAVTDEFLKTYGGKI